MVSGVNYFQMGLNTRGDRFCSEMVRSARIPFRIWSDSDPVGFGKDLVFGKVLIDFDTSFSYPFLRNFL